MASASIAQSDAKYAGFDKLNQDIVGQMDGSSTTDFSALAFEYLAAAANLQAGVSPDVEKVGTAETPKSPSKSPFGAGIGLGGLSLGGGLGGLGGLGGGLKAPPPPVITSTSANRTTGAMGATPFATTVGGTPSLGGTGFVQPQQQPFQMGGTPSAGTPATGTPTAGFGGLGGGLGGAAGGGLAGGGLGLGTTTPPTFGGGGTTAAATGFGSSPGATLLGSSFSQAPHKASPFGGTTVGSFPTGPATSNLFGGPLGAGSGFGNPGVSPASAFTLENKTTQDI